MNPGETSPETAAILAPTGRDSSIIAGLLGDDGIASAVFADLATLVPGLNGCSFAILTDETLLDADLSDLAALIEAQPDWSDFPFILLTVRDGEPERGASALHHMRALGNVTFLERPFHAMTLVSLARTALGSRRRQYQARDRLAAIEASRAEIGRSDERLKFALDAGKLGAWQLDLDDKVLETSVLCRSQFGRPAEAGFTYDQLLGSLHPEDRERVIAAAQAAIDDRADLEVGTRVVTLAGETRWVEIRGRATYREGRAHEMAGVTFDITQRKLADERQNLLIRELHHRVKNTLSTVQAIVGATARGAHSIDGFYRDFTGRILSLANTHTILTEELWQRAPLAELLRKELEMYDDHETRVTIDGPVLDLPSDYAVPLGMAFHELSTNAAKYGALSNSRGRISVNWTVDEMLGRPRVNLQWVESGGPPVATPTRQGFGTRLLDRVLTAQVKAEVGIDYAPAGLRVTLSFALPDTPVGAPPKGWS